MAGPDSGVDVVACSVSAVRSALVAAFPSDWPAGRVFEAEMDAAAFGFQGFGQAPVAA